VAHYDQFDGFDAAFEDAAQRPAACIVCETMLPEAVDGSLSAAEQRVFDAHIAGCTACSLELAEAQRGAAWLGMLKSTPPEPPAHLLQRILAGTSEAGAVATASSLATPPMRDVATHGWGTQTAVPAHIPEAGHGAPGFVAGLGTQVSGFFGKLSEIFSLDGARATFQPRLAMTAAMAFFSIALTLNLTGVRLSSLHAENFTPSGMRRMAADTTASLTRTFQNNRSVYQVESRLNELNRDDAPREGVSGR